MLRHRTALRPAHPLLARERRSWARAAGRGRCGRSSATSRSSSSTATCSSTSTCAGSWPCTAPRARGRRSRCGRTRSPTPTRRWSAIGRGGSSRSRDGRPRRAAPSRCSRACTSSTRRSSTGCPRAPPTACSTSTSRCWPRARTCRACPRGVRGTISAAPSLYRDAQLRLLPGRGRDRVLVDGEARVGATARLRRSVVGAGARVAGGARVERSVLWDGAVVEAGARVSGAIVVTGGVVRSGEKAEGVIVLPAEALGAAGRGRGPRGAAGGHGVGGASVRHDRRGPLDAEGALALIRAVRRREAPRRRGRGLGGAALRGRVHAALLPAGERGPQLRARALSRALPARGAQLPHGPRASRVVRAAGARHRRRGRPAGDRAAGGPGRSARCRTTSRTRARPAARSSTARRWTRSPGCR